MSKKLVLYLDSMKKRKYPVTPSYIKVSAKKRYEVLHIEDFADGETLGECRFGPPQIVLKKGQTARSEFSTFLHEMIHMISAETEVPLTEKQVLKLESFILKLLINNNWI